MSFEYAKIENLECTRFVGSAPLINNFITVDYTSITNLIYQLAMN